MSNCITKNFEGDKREKAKALKQMYESQEAMPKMNKSKGQEDLLKDVYLNPIKYAEQAIAKGNSFTSAWIDILGGSVVDLMSPVVGKGHKELARRSRLYKDTISLIRSGFTNSEMVDKMRHTLGMSGDVDESMMNDLLQMSEAISQESNTYLEEELPDLDHKINTLYTDEKDRVKVFKLFSRTGIANLQYIPEVAKGYLKGDMTLNQALKMAENSGVTMNDEVNAKLDDVVEYYIEGVSENGYVNPKAAELIDNRYETIVALRALKRIQGSTQMIKDMDKDLLDQLYALTLAIDAQNKEINLRQSNSDGATLDPMKGQYKIDYDGHMMKDAHDAVYEYETVTESALKSAKYSKDNDWKVLVSPKDKGGIIGVVARKKLDAATTPGVGLNADRFNNGFYLNREDSRARTNNLDRLGSKEKQEEYLRANNMVRSGNRYRLRLSEEIKAKELGMKQSAAHTLIRTFVANKELIEMQSIRDIIMDKATEKIKNTEELLELNKKVARNHGKAPSQQEVLPMFLKLDMEYESYDALPIWIKRRYTTATGLSSFNGFNKEITLVRTSVKDEVLGHPNFSLFGKNGPRSLAKMEVVYKEIVILAKQKMVITNPTKLAKDAISNIGILGMRDVNVIEMKNGFSEGMTLYKEFNGLRNKLVHEKLKMRMGDATAKNRIAVIEDKMKKHGFYDAFQAGFVQSYSTSLMVKEFDTLSGLQADMDNLVESLTKDKAGNPNEVFNAIKKWQKFGESKGLTVDSLIKGASELSKVNGTTIGTEMGNIANRLERHRKDPDSVARYVNELLGGPSSEMVRIGGAVMVTMDVLSKYTLAKALMKRNNPKTKKQYTKEEAYIDANNTFIDYRRNLPKEIKTLSDYGILMFPSFWIKAQKVIVGLVHYHPATAISGYMIADALDFSEASFLDVNLVNKWDEGSIINDPTNLFSWSVVSPFM